MRQLRITSEEGIREEKELSDGRSGASVYRLKVRSNRSRNSGYYIVKCLDTENKWYSHDNSEAERNKRFRSEAKDFESRLVELCDEQIVGKWHVLIYRQANDSIIHSMYLKDLQGNRQIECLSLISEELLTKMNSECLTDGELISTDFWDFFASILKYRIHEDSGKEGTFITKAKRMLKFPSASAIIIEGVLYPNPVFYFSNPAKWIPKNKTIDLHKGIMHGDLHAENIICTDSDNPVYSIIDYDSFEENGYLFFDQAYLELYLYLSRCEKDSISDWYKNVVPLLEKSIYESVSLEKSDLNANIALVKIRNAIFEAVAEWVGKNCTHQRDDIEIQLYMARVAAGVNFFSKGGINDFETLRKIFVYIGINLRILFEKLGYNWAYSDVSTVIDPTDTEKVRMYLWENCAKLLMSYIPVLVTDDQYEADDYRCLESLAKVPWGFVFDCGEHTAPRDFSSVVSRKLISHRHIDSYSESSSSAFTYTPSSCMWISIKKEASKPYLKKMLPHRNNINKMWKSFISVNGLKPYIFIFDCKENDTAARRVFELAIDSIERLRGSRFIALQKEFFDTGELQSYEDYNWKLANYSCDSLVDLADTIKMMYPDRDENNNQEVILPCIDSVKATPLSDKELTFYATSVELVYPSMPADATDEDCISFYQGNEAGWGIFAHNYDLVVCENYQEKIQRLKSEIDQGVKRNRRLKIYHGAGTGGTTLSKRILWDMKETVPCMRLLHYTKDTANILLEIYNRHKKTILLSVEIGSSVISLEELNNLCDEVASKNGKLWVLEIERKREFSSENENALICLFDTMPARYARDFCNRFKGLTNDPSRQRCLDYITNSAESKWMARRCPFFYGFYAFEEDYELKSLHKTISGCASEIKSILSDMALVTIFSQNIGIPYSEVARRIPGCANDAYQQTVHDTLDTAVSKFIVNRKEGMWAICHPIIAKRLLEEIYSVDNYKKCIYDASISFVEGVSDRYGENDEIIDKKLRELFIDRLENDDEKMKFSQLVDQIPETTKRIELFERLIDLYPYNAHYYNHLSRIKVTKSAPDYPSAIQLMEKAISIAETSNSTSIHYVTLGSIYSKKITSYLRNIQWSIRSGILSPDIATIILEIKHDYDAAVSAFANARNGGEFNNSYLYFPLFYLEYQIIDNLVQCDKKERHIKELFECDENFRNWYLEHYGKAVQVFSELKRNCYEDKRIIENTRALLMRIDTEDDTIESKLQTLTLNESGHQSEKRTYAAALYSRNHFDWHRMGSTQLNLIEKAMRQNLYEQLKEDSIHDLDFWLESYRRLPNFNADDAIQMIYDYMEDGL